MTNVEEEIIFCGKCGSKQPVTLNFCQKCGNALQVAMQDKSLSQSSPLFQNAENDINRIPESIRTNLGKDQSHRKLTCLECGYVGLMGISEVIAKKSSSWMIFAVAGGVALFGLLLGPIGLVGGIVIGVVIGVYSGMSDASNQKVHVECPSCLKKLVVK